MSRVPIRSRRGWLLAAGLAPLAVAAADPAPEPQPGPRRDAWPRRRPTPLPALTRADGTAWTAAAERGRPLLLNFWASWCEPCRDEMPSLQQLADDLHPRGLRVLAVNYRESPAAIAAFAARTALQLTVLRDPDGSAARAFGVRIFPSTVALDRAGRAVFSVVGQADWSGPPARGWAAALLTA